MARRKKASQPKEEVFTCGYCNVSFRREHTLVSHMCEQKRRWLNKDEKFTKIGFEAYRRFYELQVRKKVTFEDFAKSRYYTSFTKFGKHCIDLHVQSPQKFIDFVLENSIPLDNWCKDIVYEEFIRWMSLKEPVESAIERNILLFQQWSIETGEPWNDFFEKVKPTMAVAYIRQGKLSPWVIYNSSKAQSLLNRLSSEQIDLIHDYINPDDWNKKFKQNPEEEELAREIIKEAKL